MRRTTEAATTVKGDLKVTNNFKDVPKDKTKFNIDGAHSISSANDGEAVAKKAAAT